MTTHSREPSTRPTAAQIVDGVELSGKTCVITGASSGLGRVSARALAAAGAHVVLAARNAGALDQAAASIRAAVVDARVTTVHMDLASLASIRAAAAVIADSAPTTICCAEEWRGLTTTEAIGSLRATRIASESPKTHDRSRMSETPCPTCTTRTDC
jgi:NAD(P)-dependent dehydrogenase (short-subunit alcohol dehydrogenase family)